MRLRLVGDARRHFASWMLAAAFLVTARTPARAQPTSAETPSASDPVYARVGDVVIRVSEVQGAVDAAGARSQAQVQAIASELIQHQLLLREARVRGVHLHAEVRRTWRMRMVQRFLRDEIDARHSRAAVTDDAVQAYYEANPSRFSRGLEASRERIRAQLWREARDGAVMALVAACEARWPPMTYPERLALIPREPEPATEAERIEARFECPHCARQREEGGPARSLPEWALRRRRQ